jgi:hypothetical protein
MEIAWPHAYGPVLMRGVRGQTAAETLGALLVVSVIIAATATTDAGAKIASESKRIVCEIAGGGCPAEPVEPGQPDEPEPFELEGPPIVDRALPVLPFPGSVTVTCTVDSRQPETCIPKGRPGVSVQASGEIKIERSQTRLDLEGCPFDTLSIQASMKFIANAEARNARASGNLQAYLGRSTKYAITVTPGNAESIEDGDRLPPNPLDPTTLNQGESIQLSEEYYAGVKASGTYRHIQLEMGYDEGTRVSAGVRRVDDTTVRVMLGDEEFVRQALRLGISLGDAGVSIGNSKDLSDGRLEAIDLDISTAAGWNAYQAFVESGELPNPGAPGTSSPTRSQVVRYTDSTEFSAKLGGLSIGGPGASSEGRWVETENLIDGTTEYTAHVRYNDTSFAIVTTEDADGDPVGAPRYSLMLHGVHESYIPTLYERTGAEPPEGDPPSDIRIDFTEADLQELQDLALSRLADQIELNRNGRPTNDEIRESIQENHGVIEHEGVQYDFGGLESALAMATTPDEILAALYRSGFYSPNNVFEELALLTAGEQFEWPGTVNLPSC